MTERACTMRDLRRRHGNVSRIAVIQEWARESASRAVERWADEHDGQYLDGDWAYYNMVRNVGIEPDSYIELLAADPERLAEYEANLDRDLGAIDDFEAILAGEDRHGVIASRGTERAHRFAANQLETLYQHRAIKLATLDRVRELRASLREAVDAATRNMQAGIERRLQRDEDAAANLYALDEYRLAGLPPPAPPFLLGLAANVAAMAPPVHLPSMTGPREVAA